jgi:hypothetical protein
MYTNPSTRVFEAFGRMHGPIVMEWMLPRLRGILYNTTFETFVMNMGDLPYLVQKRLRSLRTFDIRDPLGMLDEEEQAEPDHVIADCKPWSLYSILQKYYNVNAPSFDGLTMTGSQAKWWTEKLAHVRRMLGKNSMTLAGACARISKHIFEGLECYKSAVYGGMMRSDRIQQALWAVDHLNTTDFWDCNLDDFITRRLQHGLHAVNEHSPYMRARCILFLLFKILNKNFVMNSANLELLYDMMVSSLQYILGSHSTSFHASFMVMIMVLPCYGHGFVSTQNGKFRMTGKPNGTGLDMTVSRYNRLMKMLMTKFGVSVMENKQTAVNIPRQTAVAIEIATCVSIVGDVVTSYPPSDLNKRPVCDTEQRGGDITSYIKSVNRGENQLKYSMTEQCWISLATNCNANNQETNERWTTLRAVCKTNLPGAAAPGYLVGMKRSFNTVACHKNSSRDTDIDDTQDKNCLLFMIAFSNLFATVMVAAPHDTGVIPFEINWVTQAFCDWIFLYVQAHMSSLFGLHDREGFLRLRQGYEGRGVVETVWTHSLIELMHNSRDMDIVARETTQGLALGALDIGQVC